LSGGGPLRGRKIRRNVVGVCAVAVVVGKGVNVAVDGGGGRLQPS
jgi:hypothetical protein